MSKKTQNTVHIHRKLPRNPYIKLHKRLVDFSNNAELDPELMLRNEYLRLENMILRGMYFEERERLKFSEEEKIEMASAMSRVRGRSRHKASLFEVSTKDISEAENPDTFAQHAQVAKRGGNVAKTAREQLEKELGHSVISPENAKTLGIAGSMDLPFEDEEAK